MVKTLVAASALVASAAATYGSLAADPSSSSYAAYSSVVPAPYSSYASSSYVASSAAPSASAPAFEMPTCWSACFAQYQVESEGCLCSDALGDVVSSCIATGCESADSEAYASWLYGYCAPVPSASNTWTSSIPAYTVPASTSYPADGYSYPVASGSAAPSYSAPSYSADGYPSGAPSVCTESSTLIYRSTTLYAPYTVTHPASGYPTASGTGYYAATGTGAAYPSNSWGPVPATGAGSSVKAAGLLVGAGAVAALLL